MNGWDWLTWHAFMNYNLNIVGSGNLVRIQSSSIQVQIHLYKVSVILCHYGCEHCIEIDHIIDICHIIFWVKRRIFWNIATITNERFWLHFILWFWHTLFGCCFATYLLTKLSLIKKATKDILDANWKDFEPWEFFWWCGKKRWIVENFTRCL